MANDPKDPDAGKADTDLGDRKVPTEGKRSGRVSFDSRGNSVWEWQLETGVYSRDVSTQKLKKLDLGDLSIAETAIQKQPPGLDAAEPRAGGGFNPYDNTPPTKRGGFNPHDNTPTKRGGVNPYDNARAGKTPASKPQAQPQRSPPRSLDELRKLSEWIKLKKTLAGKKD